MFNRPAKTYNHNEAVVRGISRDECSPLNVISDIIEDGSKVLDLGAGAGLLADIFSFKGKSVCIDGIEKDEYAGRQVKGKYRKFYCGDFIQYINEFTADEYDYIVLADVIEHLVDPQQFMESLHEFMGSNTRLIISVPNVAFGSVALSLLDGRFNYTDTGLVEKTHLRFFTFVTLAKLFAELNFFPEKIYYLHRNFLETEIDIKVSLPNLIPVLSLGRNRLATVYQFIYVLNLAQVSSVDIHFGKGYQVDLMLLLKYFFQGRIVKPVRSLFT